MQLTQVLKLPGDSGESVTGPLPDKFTNLASVVSNAIPFIFPIAGVILLLYLVWGGFDILTSMGDSKKVEAAKGKVTNAIVGFLIIFFAYWIVQILDNVFRLGVYSK